MRNILLRHVLKGVLQSFHFLTALKEPSVQCFSLFFQLHRSRRAWIELMPVPMQRKGLTESSLVFQELSTFLLCQLKYSFSNDAGNPTAVTKQTVW